MESVVGVGMVHAPAEFAEGSCDVLPRALPFVGLLRHAPPSEDCVRELEPALKKPAGQGPAATATADDLQLPPRLPRRSPYVGFHRHAPPSPTLAFRPEAPPSLPLDLPELGEADVDTEQRLGSLTEEVWALVLSHTADLQMLCPLACVARSLQGLVLLPGLWAERSVFVPPQALAPLAPRLGAWCDAWRLTSQVTIPHSKQFLAEVTRLAPELRVDVQWRFSEHFKGAGVEVLRHGACIRRVADEDVVVIGDAPLAVAADGSSYLEVRLEELGEDIGDGLNDFGVGVTATEPDKLDEMVTVADECPRSWVADFSENCVCLSVENCEEAKSRKTSFKSLCVGDRIGLRVAAGGASFELFINGALRETFVPRPGRRIPVGAQLYPLVDLYGHAVQMSRTYARAPRV